MIVLVVEDDAPLRAALAEVLHRYGFEVAVASNGLEAIELLVNGPRPDVILSDLVMPAMNGWELRAFLANDDRCRAIPLVIMSASRVGVAACERQGLPVLRKPFAVDALVAAVHAAATGTDAPPSARSALEREIASLLIAIDATEDDEERAGMRRAVHAARNQLCGIVIREQMAARRAR